MARYLTVWRRPDSSVPRTRPRVPGDTLICPPVLAAIAILIANDHYLKWQFPGVITGKVSDVAGLVFFPVLFVAGIEGLRRLVGVHQWTLSSRALGLAVVFSGVAFAMVKISPDLAAVYSSGLGVIRWPLRALMAVAQGRGVPSAEPVTVLADRTDLVALPALAVAWFVGRSHADCRVDHHGAAGSAPP